MKLSTSYVWKTGLVALGVLSVVSLQSAGAQTATTPSAGNSAATTTGNGANAGNATGSNAGNGSDANDNGAMGGNWSNGQGNNNHGGRMNGGRMSGGRGEMGGRAGMKMNAGGVNAQAIAGFLGLTTEQLKADLDAGQSLSQIAVAQGKTRDALRTFLIQQATTSIDAALDATVTSKANGAGTTPGGNATTGNGTTTTPGAASTPTT